MSSHPCHGASFEKIAAEDAAIKINPFQDDAPFLLLFAERIAGDAPPVLIPDALKHLSCTDLIWLAAERPTPSGNASWKAQPTVKPRARKHDALPTCPKFPEPIRSRSVKSAT